PRRSSRRCHGYTAAPQGRACWSGYSRRQYGPRTSLLSPIRFRIGPKFLLSRAGVRKREHDALPHDHWGPASSYNYPTWMRGLLMDRRRFRQPILGLSPPFADLFCENTGSLLADLP